MFGAHYFGDAFTLKNGYVGELGMSKIFSLIQIPGFLVFFLISAIIILGWIQIWKWLVSLRIRILRMKKLCVRIFHCMKLKLFLIFFEYEGCTDIRFWMRYSNDMYSVRLGYLREINGLAPSHFNLFIPSVLMEASLESSYPTKSAHIFLASISGSYSYCRKSAIASCAHFRYLHYY